MHNLNYLSFKILSSFIVLENIYNEIDLFKQVKKSRLAK